MTNGPPWNEDAQMDHLSDRTALVTVGIGGNDLNFGPPIADCVLKHFIFSGCEENYDGQATDALLALYDHSTGLNRLQQAYSDIRFKAWRGRELAFGYPRFFGLEGGSDWWSSGLLVPRCQNIRVSDQLWINHKIDQLDSAIRVSAESMGVQYVDIENASQGHELCKDDPGFLNGIVLSNRVESFHPSKYGHSVIAGALKSALQSGPFGGSFAPSAAAPVTSTSNAVPGSPFTVGPGQTVSAAITVAAGPEVSFSSSWPGSDIVMTLRSPSGRVVDRATTATDVYHRVGPTQELYLVSKPEAGIWTVELYGASVQPGGEPTTLDVFETPKPNADPAARFKSTLAGRTVSLDASGSTDADGKVVKYLWDFGDDSLTTGTTASHTYTQAGTYRVTLVIADDNGGFGFATGTADIVVPKYEFGGFKAPVQNQPELNLANAGSSVPVKFTVGNTGGADILDPAFPQTQQIDCVTRTTLGGSTATGSRPDWVPQPAGSYHYSWKTSKEWAGTCRRLVIGFDDGSRHPADFWFE